MLGILKHMQCGLIVVLLVLSSRGLPTTEPAYATPYDSASYPSVLKVIDTMPQPGAGLIYSNRVPDDTSFAVLIEAAYGIDFNDPDSIYFLISDGEHGIYKRNLNSSAVRLVEVDNNFSPATLVWAVYDRSLEPDLPPYYALETIVKIWMEALDIYRNKISVEHHEFKIESDSQQAYAFDHLPESRPFKVDNAGGFHDAGVEIVSGDLSGAMILYDSDEPLYPAFGSIEEIEAADSGTGQALGFPLNLMPHTVFNNPVKLYIPFPEDTDVTTLDIYYFNGVQWLPACGTGENLLPGGNGWMVPGSRVNHIDRVPPLVEIEVYHFSAASGVVAGTSTTTDRRHSQSSGSGVAVYAECFIESAATVGLSSYWAILVPIISAAMTASIVADLRARGTGLRCTG